MLLEDKTIHLNKNKHSFLPDGIGVFDTISGNSICNIEVISLVKGVVIRSFEKSASIIIPFLSITLP